MTITIRVFYSCALCRLKKVAVDVVARRPDETLMAWMDVLGNYLQKDHLRRSPGCQATTCQDVMIPTGGPDHRVGGPPLQ